MKSKIIRLAPCIVLLAGIIFVNSCKKDKDTDPPPGIVTNLTSTPGVGSAALTWTDPTDNDLDHISIDITPGSWTTLSIPAGTEGVNINGLPNGTLYTFSLKAVDDADQESDSVTVTCMPNTPFTVTAPTPNDNFKYGPPYFSSNPSGQVIIEVELNRPVDTSTVVSGQTIYIEAGSTIANGTVAFSNSDSTITFTTNDAIGTWCNFNPDCDFEFKLIGTDAGNGVVKDANNMVLDGDDDGTPGGNYEITKMIVIGK